MNWLTWTFWQSGTLLNLLNKSQFCYHSHKYQLASTALDSYSYSVTTFMGSHHSWQTCKHAMQLLNKWREELGHHNFHPGLETLKVWSDAQVTCMFSGAGQQSTFQHAECYCCMCSHREAHRNWQIALYGYNHMSDLCTKRSAVSSWSAAIHAGETASFLFIRCTASLNPKVAGVTLISTLHGLAIIYNSYIIHNSSAHCVHVQYIHKHQGDHPI